jgi:hypothetical protein
MKTFLSAEAAVICDIHNQRSMFGAESRLWSKSGSMSYRNILDNFAIHRVT